MLTTAALAVYRSAGTIGSPALRWHLHRRVRLGKEDPVRLKERFGKASLSRPPGSLFWIHAASVGESVAVLPLIQRFQSEFPRTTQLLTTTTRTSAELISTKLPGKAIHQFAPFDTPRWTRNFLAHWRPDVGVLVESEIWPSILTEARARDMPLALVNGRVSKRSATNWSRMPALASHMFGLFDKVLAQSPEDEGRLRRLGAADAKYSGNLRFAAPQLAADPKALEDEKKRLSNREIWVAASTHEGEEKLIGGAHKRLVAQRPGLLTIIVPRHPSRGQTVVDRLTELGLRTARRSLGEPLASDTDIYLADTLGELGLWFRLTQIAFIGGSLVPAGGHNPLEPARLNCALLCGPHMESHAVPMEHLRSAAAVSIVESEAEIAKTVLTLLKHKNERQRTITAAAQCAAAEASALDRIFAALQPMLASALRNRIVEGAA